jgi:hypothetical protein
LGFVVEPVEELVPEDEPMSDAAPFLAFFAAFLLAFFDFFDVFVIEPFESLFVVVVDDESLVPPVEPVWAKAPNEASAKAESAATIVRIMLISFVFPPGVCRTGGCPPYSKARAVHFGEIFPGGTGLDAILACVCRSRPFVLFDFSPIRARKPGSNPCYKPPAAKRGPLAELADAVDSKSTALRGIPVRFRGGPPAHEDRGPQDAVASAEGPGETGGSR